MLLVASVATLFALSSAPPLATAAPGGSISGKVTAAAGGAPLEGIEACAYETIAPYTEVCATTDASGQYLIDGLAADSYGVYFYAPEGSGLNYVGRGYPNTVTVADSEVPDVDIELDAGARIRGTVTDESTHTGLAGIEICAYPAEAPDAPSAPPTCAESEPGGAYSLAGLPEGEYKVYFTPPQRSSLNYIARYYGGVPTYADATVVSLNAGEIESGVDEALPPGGQISGRAISAATSTAISGLEACAYSDRRRLPLCAHRRDRCLHDRGPGDRQLPGRVHGPLRKRPQLPDPVLRRRDRRSGRPDRGRHGGQRDAERGRGNAGRRVDRRDRHRRDLRKPP